MSEQRRSTDVSYRDFGIRLMYVPPEQAINIVCQRLEGKISPQFADDNGVFASDKLVAGLLDGHNNNNGVAGQAEAAFRDCLSRCAREGTKLEPTAMQAVFNYIDKVREHKEKAKAVLSGTFR